MGTNLIDFPKSVSDALDQLNQVPDAASWPVSERMTAYFFMLLDELDELNRSQNASMSGTTESEKDVVDFATIFKVEASGFNSAFHIALRNSLTSVARAPDVSSINRLFTDTTPARFVAAEVLIQLLLASLQDASEDRQRSAALADKTLAYIASIWATPVPQKAVDLARYSVEAGYLHLDRIPFIADWFKQSGHPEEDDDGKEDGGL
jgi:hypothetical protein